MRPLTQNDAQHTSLLYYHCNLVNLQTQYKIRCVLGGGRFCAHTVLYNRPFAIAGDDKKLFCLAKLRTSGGTRTRNPRLRRPVPYPLGHGGNCLLARSKVVVFLESARKHAPYLLRLIHIQITGSSRHSTRNKQTSPSDMALEPLPPLTSSWHPKTAWPNG